MVHRQVGYDAGKQIKGRKRFLAVDTLGLVLVAFVTAAQEPERAGGRETTLATSKNSRTASVAVTYDLG